MEKSPSIFSLLKPYRGFIAFLVLLALGSNVLNLIVPKIISHAIDGFVMHTLSIQTSVLEFAIVALTIFVFVALQSIVQTIASERVARDLRTDLAAKISRQSTSFIQGVTPSKLLTNLTSDIDGIKLFVSQAIVSLASSLFLIVGASIILLSINWKLALVVLMIIPLIGGTFFFTLSKVRVLFKKAQEVIDKLNKVINESILGSALIRVLNSQSYEFDKFIAANTEAKSVGMSILRMFAGLIPTITFVANLAMLAILALGGHYIITGSMTLGDFAAFNSYVALLIFPILMLGFMSNIMAQATASYGRISEVLNAAERVETGTLKNVLLGNIEVKNATLSYGEKPILKDASFSVKAGTKVAIIGPTAAGKTQLLYALTGLVRLDKGSILYDGKNIDEYESAALHKQVGFVFQDSIMFNLTLRENIAFNTEVTADNMQRAIDTAELHDFLEALPDGLETMVSERGTSLSGGQKQRVMLARALALNPKILLLDDFTARVDAMTQEKILMNLMKNYPGITLLSVTQQIAPIEKYDQIILLMEGEVLANGTHRELVETSPEYMQILESQKSTSRYEVQS